MIVMDGTGSLGSNSPKIGYNHLKDAITIKPEGRGRPYELKVHDNGEIHPHLLDVYRTLTGAGPTDDARLGKITAILSEGRRSDFFNALEQQGLCPELQNYGNGETPDGVHETEGNLGQTSIPNPMTINLDPIYPSDITPETVLHYVHVLEDIKSVQNPYFLAEYISGRERAPRGFASRIDRLFGELREDGLLCIKYRTFSHKLTGKPMKLKVYETTHEGVKYLATGELPEGLPNSAYHRHDEQPIMNVTPVSMAEPTETGVLETVYKLTIEWDQTIRSLQYLTDQVSGIKHASRSMIDDVYHIIKGLEEQGFMSVTQRMVDVNGNEIERKVYELTKDGIEYLENLGSDSPDTTEIVPDKTITDTTQKEDRTVEKDEGPTYVYDVEYTWDDLSSGINRKFKDLLSGNSESVPKLKVNGAESFLLYTGLDSTEGFPGAVYLCLDGDAFCTGYVDESGKVVPSPEAVWATFINKNAIEGTKGGRRALISFFKELDASSSISGSLSRLMRNNIEEVAGRLYNRGTYRDAEELTTNKGNLSDRGRQFFSAVQELFGTKPYSERDGSGKEHRVTGNWFDESKYLLDTDRENHTVSGGSFDISEYIPKNDVEPEDNVPEIPKNPQGGKMTSGEADEWIKKHGQ